MAQFMVKPIHAPRQFMPARAIHWPSAAMPPPAGCYLKYWEMPGFQQDNPPVSFADSLLCTRRPWDGANPEDIGRCGGRGEAAAGRQVAAPTLTRPYINTPLRLRRGGIRKGTSRAPSPTVGGADSFVCFQSSRRDTFMRHGAIHGETNSCPKAIHARQGNSLAIGRDASPTLGCEPGGIVLK